MPAFFTSIQTEWLKTKRTSAMWLALIGAAFIPFISLLMFTIRPDHFLKELSVNPWQQHIYPAWRAASVFLLPMYVILTTSLVVQIEYRNNTWKQVYASPRSYTDIYFSKFIIIQAMILSCFILFNLFLLLTGYATSIINSGYHFMQKPVPWRDLLLLSFKMYVSSLAITSIQYWLSLRLKNYIAPLGIGLALLITGLIILEWEKIYYYPYAYTALSFFRGANPGSSFALGKNEWYSLIWFGLIVLAGLADTVSRKEHG